MTPEAKKFFLEVLETPSPSGYEQPVQRLVREYSEPFADGVHTDSHGNVVVSVNADAPLRVMFAGHCDQIGLIVTYIDEFGFVYTKPIGGWDPQQLIGQRMTIHTDSGPVPAVISRKPIHLLEEEERKQVVKQKEMWLDVGVKSEKEAKELIQVGDPVTLNLGCQEMRNGFANGPGMDNKTGMWVCIEAARRAAERGGLKVAVHAVATVQEEIGLRGARTSAYGIDPHVGVAVDVTHATDCPTIDKTQEADIRLGGGPVIERGPNINPAVFSRLKSVGESAKLPMQWAALNRGASNDGNALQLTRAGVATGIVGIPLRYMHSAVEVISLDDIDHAADLLAEFVLSLEADADFTPR
ncbi:M42 family metallopeptidase [Botrimarina sp.]|uniref:M42 family metallopeptidase n=1 Tax=Botrimarina sp. TaxID=2795802 RepID=UPI0032ED612B